MNRRAFPYRRPHPDAVSTSGWTLRLDDGTAVPLPSALADWDYQTNLGLECSIDVDLDTVRETAGLPPEAELILTTVWTSSGSGLRMLAHRITLDGAGVRTVQPAFTVLGRESGGILTLETQLVLARRLDNPDPTGARRAGSVLWRRRTQVRLQGDASQFPMAVVDFLDAGYPADAPWHLEIGRNLEAATMGSLLLLVNSRTTLVLEALRKANKASPAERMIQSALRQDVTRLMIEHALDHDDLDDDSAFEPDTLGHTLLGVVRTHFPETDVASLRSVRRGDPALLSTRIQDAAGLFAKES
ncbi:hypothetical protein [Streptomyces sp. NPDC002573]|uniref:hypothetical protein n=1 Tax=Streptomyces sp. NPDC002573 TaxID=3364651 RepID=UPI0036B01C1F